MLNAAELLGSVADSDDTAYSLCSALKLVAVNASYLRFARANGGVRSFERWRDESVLAAMTSALRPFFFAGFEHARATGEPWEHQYECSSPEVLRTFHMTAYPVEGEGLFLVHSLRFETAHVRRVHVADGSVYARSGWILMCSHCRRVRNECGSERWDWVPAYLDPATPNISHGLCKPCAAFHWGMRV